MQLLDKDLLGGRIVLLKLFYVLFSTHYMVDVDHLDNYVHIGVYKNFLILCLRVVKTS